MGFKNRFIQGIEIVHIFGRAVHFNFLLYGGISLSSMTSLINYNAPSSEAAVWRRLASGVAYWHLNDVTVMVTRDVFDGARRCFFSAGTFGCERFDGSLLKR